MTAFEHACESNGFRDQPIEDIREPREDSLQDAWVNVLAYAQRKSLPTPPAQSPSELFANYQHLGGLVVVKSKQAIIDAARKSKGRANVRTITSLDQATLGGDSYIEYIEDPRSEIETERVEAEEEIQALFANALPSVRAALMRFVTAWLLQEQGDPIPRHLSAALARDRARTGFAFQLERGRIS